MTVVKGTPPRPAEKILQRLLPKNVAGMSIVGDLREEYRDLTQRTGTSTARWWYWQTVLFLLLRYNWIRMRSALLSDRPTDGWVNRKATMSDALQDIRYGVRRLSRSPAFTIIVVLTLALGIGANTTIFSVVNSLLLRPLPYPEPGQLVTLNHVYPSVDLVTGVSAPGFRDYRDRTQSFESVAITRGWSANLTGLGEPVRVSGSRVSARYFATFGVFPVVGRSFLPQEDTPGFEHVVVISDGFWKRRLGGAPDLIGESVLLNDESYEIVGVMPPEFEDFFDRNREFWVPLALPPEAFSDDYRISESQRSMARLKSGVSVAAAAQELTNLAETIKAELPGTYPPGWTVRVTSATDRARSGYKTTLFLLFGAVGFVLLITCANVANLLLARGIGRQKDIAIRKALGASRRQVIRQLLAESAVLSLSGGTAGLLLAVWGINTLIAIGPQVLSSTEIAIDGRVLFFTLGVSLLAAVLFGLAPALQGTGHDIQRILREGGQASRADRSGHGLRRLLIVGEFALALILLAGSGLMIQSVSRLRQVDPGFKPDHILSASIRIPVVRYPDEETRVAFYDQLLSELEAVPGIRAVTTTTVLPFGGGWGTSVFNVEGYVPDENNPAPWGDIRVVSPSYARTLEIPVQRGRFFDLTDGPESQGVVVVDEEMVRRFWPDENPLGKRITFDDPASEDAEWITVIGVVGHTLHAGLDDDVRIQLYFSVRQAAGTSAILMIRTETEPEAMISAARQAVFSVDPNQPISGIRIMDDLITESIGNRRLLMLLLSLFSGLAMLLASLGIYGIMAHMVKERSRELGLRMALGATRPSLFGLVMQNGLKLAGIGLMLGVGGAFALTRLLQSQLFGVSAADPMTLTTVVVVLLGVALLAILLPANRAARVDPIDNLRTE
jgi:predicted permease